MHLEDLTATLEDILVMPPINRLEQVVMGTGQTLNLNHLMEVNHWLTILVTLR